MSSRKPRRQGAAVARAGQAKAATKPSASRRRRCRPRRSPPRSRQRHAAAAAARRRHRSRARTKADIDVLDAEAAVQTLMTAACRLYSAKIEAGGKLLPLSDRSRVTLDRRHGERRADCCRPAISPSSSSECGKAGRAADRWQSPRAGIDQEVTPWISSRIAAVASPSRS